MRTLITAAVCVLTLTACDGRQEQKAITATNDMHAAINDMKRQYLVTVGGMIIESDARIAWVHEVHPENEVQMRRECEFRYELTERHMEIQHQLGLPAAQPVSNPAYESACATYGVLSVEDFRRTHP